MASSDMHPSVRKTQSETWLSRNGNFRKSARSFAFSTAAHILILSIFATTAVAIMIQQPELIKVKAPPVSDQEREEMLSVELPVNRASTPPGPPGPMQDTQKVGLSYLPGTPTETIEIRPLPDFHSDPWFSLAGGDRGIPEKVGIGMTTDFRGRAIMKKDGLARALCKLSLHAEGMESRSFERKMSRRI